MLLAACVLLIGCADTAGLSKESSRPPKGDPNAVVVVQEYSDLQCPACRSVHEVVVKPLLAQYSNRIRFEFKHFPLQSIHPFALRAAMAAECAADQGKFWEYVDIVFANQQELSARALDEWAAELALDTELFKRCLDSQVKKDTVLADYRSARNLDLMGTPTFLVNGAVVPTNQIIPAIDAAYASITKRL